MEVAEPDGRVFLYVGVLGMRCHMTPSLFNKAIKKVWAEFLERDKWPDNPPAITSSYLTRKHVSVSAVHSSASCEQMAETAAHMSHTLHTVETHYESHAAMQLTSRACKSCATSVFREPRTPC